jgi:TetR/AcrR family transcriptional regulator, transcriptional repressor for nem operon
MTTRTALLDCAETIVRKRGYDGFSYADLAKQVGIRKASIHHHFPAKADLAEALVQRYAERFFDVLEEADGSNESAAQLLAQYVALYRRALGEGDQLCLCVALCADRESLAQPVLAALAAFQQRSLIWLSTLFQRAADDGSISDVSNPSDKAHAALALVQGAQLIARALNDPNSFDHAVAGLEANAP